MWHFTNILNLTFSNSSTIFQIDQQILTINGDLPWDGDHPWDDNDHNDHPYPPDNNPYPPGHSENHPGCPDHLYWLLIKVSSTYTHTFDIMTTSAQRAAAVKKKKIPSPKSLNLSANYRNKYMKILLFNRYKIYLINMYKLFYKIVACSTITRL